jgi:transposase
MSKHFRRWKIDDIQLLPPSVQDYVAKGHLSRLIVALVRESLDLSEIAGSYRSGVGQPPFDPWMMTALLLHGGDTSRRWPVCSCRCYSLPSRRAW